VLQLIDCGLWTLLPQQNLKYNLLVPDLDSVSDKPQRDVRITLFGFQIMFAYSSVSRVLVSLLSLSSTLVWADQTVSLQRPLIPHGNVFIWEPLFNPSSISAVVGEKIHFQANFMDISAVPVVSPSEK